MNGNLRKIELKMTTGRRTRESASGREREREQGGEQERWMPGHSQSLAQCLKNNDREAGKSVFCNLFERRGENRVGERKGGREGGHLHYRVQLLGGGL